MTHPIAYPPESPLARGWNTWDTRSVLRQVLLPQGLALDLAIYHPGLLATVADAQFGTTAVRATAGVRLAEAEIKLREIRVVPGAHAYDGRYTCVTVMIADFSVTIESAHTGSGDLALLVTPTPVAYRAPLLVVGGSFVWNRPGRIEAAGDGPWRVVTPAGGGETIACTAPAIPAPYLARRTPAWVLPLTAAVGVTTGGARSLDEIVRLVAAARAAEAETHARFGEQAEAQAARQLCLAWNTVYEPAHRRVITVASRAWNVRRLGYAMFCWDTFFTAWLLAIDDPALARNCALEAFRDMVDGEFVPNVANGSGRRSWDRSQPCVGGLAVLALHELAPDRAFLEKVWPALLAWNRWWQRRRRNAAGLLSWGSQPFAPRIGDRAEHLQPATARGAALESGLDNTPMYDGVPFDPATHLLALSDVGLASLYIVDCEALAALARELGRADEAAELTARAEHYRGTLASLWNPDTGIFQNRRTDTGGFNPRVAPTCFYPLLAGAATPAQAGTMIARHLLNPDEFWGEWVLPSVPRTDPAFPEQHYLRGRIWAPLNFLVYLGLRRAGRAAPAAEVARRSLALFEGNWRERQGVFENYSALTGRGADEAFCDPLYAWSGLLALMAAMERGDVPLPSILRARQ